MPPPQVEVGDDGEDDDDSDEDGDGDDNEEEEDIAAADDNDNDGGRLLCVLIIPYVIIRQGIAMASTMLYLSHVLE